EWEGKIEGDTPDWDLARTTGLAPLARDGVAKGARRVFSVAVERRRFDLGLGESRIEAALDVGVIEAGKRSASIRELELELKHGRLADLFGLAKTIAETAPLRLGLRTKAEQGFAAARGRPAHPVKAAPSPIVEGMSVADAFQAIARSCLAHLLANEALFREARDPEAVHQMRVALRRLRAALSLFRDVVADDETAAIKAGLRELAAVLGDARDLDVFIRKTIAPARARDPDDAALAALETVASGRLGRIVLDTLAWIEAGPWLRKDGSAEREAPVERFAADELRRRAKRIRKRGRHLAELAPDERHRVRIAVKKLRYAAEFFAPLYDGKGRAKRTRRFRDALGELQDRLGDLNDIAVAATMAETAGDGAAPAARLLAAEQEAHFDEHLAAAAKAYKAFAESEKFWR
ncbi:MAG: CHAD domain-containing protein, partial [Microvirga sp.]